LYFREHPKDQINENGSYSKLHSTGIILKLNQLDSYDLTWGQLSRDLFRSVVCHSNFKWYIVPLLYVCRKMTIKVLREFCYVTGYYPDVDSCTRLCPWIGIEPSSSFDLHPLSISYLSSWWYIVKNSFPIHCLIINPKYQMVSSEPLSTRWDLSNLNRLVIKMPKRFDQDNQILLLKKPFNQYQLPSLKEMVLFNIEITPKILRQLNPNLESIKLVNCGMGSPWIVNLTKFKYLQKFTMHLKSMRGTSCEPCLDLTKCTIEFPGVSKRLKFKDDLMLKVL
jgi:hypothetical protein